MTRASSAPEVLDVIQQVKASAPGFCTNFFPLQKKLEAWIDHGEFYFELRPGAAFFFRQDRDFWHVYFGARDLQTLKDQAAASPELKQLAITTDIVGQEAAVAEMIAALEQAGFRRYSQLQRMARVAQPLGQTEAESAPIAFAAPADTAAVINLLEASFNRFADLLPVTYEIEAAIEQKQVLAVKSAGELAAMLYFETQGLSSTLRYWAVAGPFRAKRLGSALMRHYFESQSTVRRFMLWVATGNRNAVEKYEHYGYRADGLIDHVLANQMI